MTAKNETRPLGWREKISYGFGGMGNAIVLAMVATFLMFYYTDVVGLSAALVGTLMLVSKVFDGVSDLVMGRIVDRTKSRFGKARCYLLWLSVPYAISGVLLFLLQPSWPDTVKYVWVFVTYNLVTTVFFTGVCVPYNAMNALLTKDQYDRGVLGITNVMGNVAGQLLVNTFMLKLVAAFGDNQTAWILASVVFGAVGVAAHLICFTQTMERNGDDGQDAGEGPGFLESVRSLLHNKYWLMVCGMAVLQFTFAGLGQSGAMYYAKIVIGDASQVSALVNPMNYAQIVMYFLAFFIIKKLGKGGSFRVGFSIAAVAYAIQLIMPANLSLLIAAGALRGVGIGMAAACLGGMISDTIEYGEWKTGIRCVGVGNAANTFAQKIGNGVGTAAVGWGLGLAGYAGTATAAAEQAIIVLYTLIPMICCIGIAVIACFYRLDREYPKIMAELEERRNGKA